MIEDRPVKVGCCGFPTRQHEYLHEFGVVELQSTFYQLPQLDTAEHWRTQAPPRFEFCVKAWQIITHPATSPTWKHMSTANLPRRASRCGHLKPTRENLDAWERTLEICRILRTRVCLIQCPASYGFSKRNVENARRFFGQIDRGGMRIAWEPRGNWKEHQDVIKELCQRVDIIHAVDILRSKPAMDTDTCYFRLHGLGPREFNYRYRYSIEDLGRLKDAATACLARGAQEIYVLFNNMNMLEDARTLCSIMHTSGM